MIHRSVDCVLLDIEGTTSSIAFVYDVMFAYVREHLVEFLQEHIDSPSVMSAIDQMRVDLDDASWSPATSTREERIEVVSRQVLQWMDEDKKWTGLKALQGILWKGGFESGKLRAHIYPEVHKALLNWKELGIAIRIYSSGSVLAQKLFFGHTEEGSLLPLFDAHYDTTVGGKKEIESYRHIAEDIGLPCERILFVSDIAAELEAAAGAGMQMVACCRPGNAPLPNSFRGERIQSFDELELRRFGS